MRKEEARCSTQVHVSWDSPSTNVPVVPPAACDLMWYSITGSLASPLTVPVAHTRALLPSKGQEPRARRLRIIVKPDVSDDLPSPWASS